MKLHRAAYLLAACLLTAASSCKPAARPTDAPEKIVVQYWEKWTGFEADAMQAVIDDFNASQDRIFIERLTVSQIDQKLMLAASSGNPPDLAGLWSHSVNIYAEKGALTPLDKFIAAAGITREHYVPVFWDLCSHRGFMWALPSTPASIGLHWNKRLFREAGLDPDRPPRSIAELDQMAEQLTVVDVTRNGSRQRVRFTELTDAEKSLRQFEIVQLGFSPAEPGWFTQMWGYWFGGNLWDDKSRATADAPANIRAFEWYGSYPEKYGLNNLRQFGASFGNFSSPQNPFLSQQVAMVLQGVWMNNFIEQYAPGLEWGAAPFPSVDPQQWQDVTIVECDVLVIPAGAQHPREAFEFIRYVNTQPVMEKLNLGQRKISPLATVSEEFIQQHGNPHIGVFMKLARSPNARYVPRIPVWNEYSEEMTVAADRVFCGSATPADALHAVNNRVQWKLDRVLRRWELVREERIKAWAQ